MKKIYLTLLILLSFFQITQAQWTGSPGDIYYNTGNVGIGFTTPFAMLHINGTSEGGVVNNLVLGNNGTSNNSATAIYMGYNHTGLGLYGVRILQTGTPLHLRSGDLSFQIHNTIASNADEAWNTALFIQRTTGNIGIGTATPDYTLQVSGNNLVSGTSYLNNGEETHYAMTYSVPTGTNVNINLTGETVTLSPGHQYRIVLNTATTSTNTGAVYIIYQTNATTWAAHMVSANGTTSNHPLLGVSGSSVYVYHNHASTYSIHTEVFGFYDINPTVTAPAFFGLDGAMTNLAGNVGIGTTAPDQKLSVNGTIHSKSVLVDLNGWSDFVFKPAYHLRPLAEVKTYVKKNHHLPDVPAAAEVEKNGLDVGKMNKILMQKVEELTLYLIEKDKQLNEQNIKLNRLADQLERLKIIKNK